MRFGAWDGAEGRAVDGDRFRFTQCVRNMKSNLEIVGLSACHGVQSCFRQLKCAEEML
jgi:hypothetical protein